MKQHWPTSPLSLPHSALEPWVPHETHLRIPPGGASILLPDGSFLLQGDYARDGLDLVITNRAGDVIRIEGYFALSNPPDLALVNGSALTFETVKALAFPVESSVLVAGPGAPGAVEPGLVVGKVANMSGTVEAKGKDGVVRTLKEGDPIQEGDQLSTSTESLAQFTMNDGTTFQLGESARALIDQYLFKPEETKGQFAATVLTGSFRYASGQIGQVHAGKHTLIKTPTAEIGVRGSELMGEVVGDGSTTVVHNAGILEIADIHGQGVVVLLKPGTATAVKLGGGAPVPVFQAPDALMKRLEGQVSFQAVIKARETEKLQQEKIKEDKSQQPIDKEHAPDPHAKTDDKPGEEKSGSDKSGGDKPQEEKPPEEKPSEEKPPEEKTGADAQENKNLSVTWEQVQSKVTQAEIKAFAETLLTSLIKVEEAIKQPTADKVATLSDTLKFSLGDYQIELLPIVNHAPILPSLFNQEVAEKVDFTLNMGGGVDPDGQDVTLRAQLASGAPLPSWLHFDATSGRFTGTPSNSDVGQLNIEVIAADPLHLTTSRSFTLTVNNVNDAPVLTHAVAHAVGRAERTVYLKQEGDHFLPQFVDGTPFTFTLPTNIFSDADLAVDPNETITLSATLLDDNGQELPLPGWLQFDPLTGRLIVEGMSFAQLGSHSVRITATDQAGAWVSDTFSLAVRLADAPVVDVGQGYFLDSAVGGITYLADDIEGSTDVNGGFTYHPGEKIIFKLGDLVLGQVKTGSGPTVTLTPVDLASATGGAHENVLINLLRLLQTLDGDHNPENGIHISPATIEHAKNLQIDLTLSPEQFAENAQLKSLLASENISALVPVQQALAHFQNTLTPEISTGAVGSPLAVNLAENSLDVALLSASSLNSQAELQWSITGGADAGLFAVDPMSGALHFNSGPDFEAPGHATGGNLYQVAVTVTDLGSPFEVSLIARPSASKAVEITVTDVNESPGITSVGTASFSENATNAVYQATASDPDAGTVLTWSLTGTDAALFAIHPTTGAVSFI
ncbi:MAG: putative Ig domain-containing protein, partial [Magnetococcus sp. YQC-9]